MGHANLPHLLWNRKNHLSTRPTKMLTCKKLKRNQTLDLFCGLTRDTPFCPVALSFGYVPWLISFASHPCQKSVSFSTLYKRTLVIGCVVLFGFAFCSILQWILETRSNLCKWKAFLQRQQVFILVYYTETVQVFKCPKFFLNQQQCLYKKILMFFFKYIGFIQYMFFNLGTKVLFYFM